MYITKDQHFLLLYNFVGISLQVLSRVCTSSLKKKKIYFWLCWVFRATQAFLWLWWAGAALHCGVQVLIVVVSLVAEHGL